MEEAQSFTMSDHLSQSSHQGKAQRLWRRAFNKVKYLMPAMVNLRQSQRKNSQVDDISFLLAKPHDLPPRLSPAARSRKHLSASELGRLCAQHELSRRDVMTERWKDPVSWTCLFDVRQGGDRIFRRSGGVCFPTHRRAVSSKGWYGRMGHTCMGGLDDFQVDLGKGMATCSTGPWLLLPSRPFCSRSLERVVNSSPALRRSPVRERNPAGMQRYKPEVLHEGLRQFQSCLMRLSNEGSATREEEKSMEVDISRYNRLYRELKKDVFQPKFEQIYTITRYFVGKKLSREENEARARDNEVQKSRKKWDKIMFEMEMEKLEADEAQTRVMKEKMEFERAQAVIEKNQTELQELIQAAEQDGVIDDDEERAIERLEVKLQIDRSRLRKEREEYLEWKARSEKELEDFLRVRQRVLSLKDHEELIRAKEDFSHKMEMLKGNMAHRSLSCILQVLADAKEAHTDFLDVQIFENPLRKIAKILTSNGSCYEGQWEGMAHGYGIQKLLHFDLTYWGEFKQDLKHGRGILMDSHFFCCGSWRKGLREGNAVIGSVLGAGILLPVVVYKFSEDAMRSFTPFRDSHAPHRKTLDLGLEAARKAAEEASKFGKEL